jgi:hypothetical protein
MATEVISKHYIYVGVDLFNSKNPAKTSVCGCHPDYMIAVAVA